MKRAFTLIELLVVIAIIAILAALVFPVFARAKSSSRTTATLSGLKQLGAATLMYQGDYDDTLPQSTEGIQGEGRLGGWSYYSRFGSFVPGQFQPKRGGLYPYVKNEQIYISQNDPLRGRSTQSYAFNGCLIGGDFRFGINSSKSGGAIGDPSGQMLLGEEGTGRGENPEGDTPTNDGFFHPLFDRFSRWHLGGTALLFVDGHGKVVREAGPKQLVGSLSECSAFSD